MRRIFNIGVFIFLLCVPAQAQISEFNEIGRVLLNAQLRQINDRLNDVEHYSYTGGTWTGGTITGSSVYASTFVGNTFSGGTFSGGTFTGGTMQTATSGSRILMNTNGLYAYDGNGNTVLEALVSGADSGDVTIGDYASNKGAKWDDSEDTFNIKGTLTADSGTIGGWHITSTALADDATAGNANILLDSANGLIRAGSTAASYITIDGTNKYIRTSDYASGPLGSGWHIGTDLAEFNNIRARGKLTTATFEKDVISSVGGNLLISDSDILNADMTALDASTLTILGDTTFAVNDILRLKDGVDDEWMVVTNIASAPTYTVTRDAGSDYTANNNPAWKKGTAVVNYGASGEGLIFMTASEANAPHIDVLTHAGAPWDTTTTRMRMGNLNGFLGYSSDLYGVAIGESDKYLKYDPTNGLQVKGTVTIGSGSTGYTNLSDKLTDADVRSQTGWSHVSDVTKIDGGDIYANTIILAALGSAVTDRMFVSADSATRVQNWAAAENATMIDGGDIYTGSVLVGSLGSDAVARMFSDSTTKNNIEGWKHASDATLIDGGDIYTSSVTVAKLGSDAKAQMFANQASRDSVVGWQYAGDYTKIDGGDIYARTLTADKIFADTITANEISSGGVKQVELNTANVENCVELSYYHKTFTPGQMAADGDIDEEIGETFVLPLGLYGLYPQQAVTLDSSDRSYYSTFCGGSESNCPYVCAHPEWDYYLNFDFLERGNVVHDGIVTDSSNPISTFSTYGYIYLGLDKGIAVGSSSSWTCHDFGCSKSKYITSSNDTDWIWLLVDKTTHNVKASQYSHDHPSVGNDPNITHPFVNVKEDEEVILVDPEILEKIKNKVTSRKSVLQVINEEYEVDDSSNPKFMPVAVKEIDPYGDRPGTVIKTEYNVPAWGQAVIGKDTVDIKERTISSLPPEIKYRKLKKKTPQIGELP